MQELICMEQETLRSGANVLKALSLQQQSIDFFDISDTDSMIMQFNSAQVFLIILDNPALFTLPRLD